MDKSLVCLLVLSLLLLAWQAPYAVLTLVGIIALAVLFVRGTWTFLQGFGQAVPEPQRVSTD